MKPCPCGKTPEKILVEGEDRSKWARCYGDCCGEWMIEYRNSYEHIPSDESQQLAEQAWNDAVRPAPPEPMRGDKHWQTIEKLRRAYCLARNAAAGLSNHCEESASTRACEKELAQAEEIYRTIDFDWWNEAVGRKA